MKNFSILNWLKQNELILIIRGFSTIGKIRELNSV